MEDLEQGVEGSQDLAGGEPQGEQKPGPLEPGGVRFEQVYGKMRDFEGQLKQFKEFGDPKEIRQQLETFKQWKKQVEDYQKQQQMTPDEKTEAQRAAAIRKELLKVYPELAEVSTLKEMKAALDEMRSGYSETKAEANMEKASVKFSETLKAAKIDTKYQSKIEEYIFSQMNEEERQEFLNTGDTAVPERIFKNELENGLFSMMKTGPKLPTPPLRNTPGGTPPNGKPKAPKDWKEAEDAAWGMIEASRG